MNTLKPPDSAGRTETNLRSVVGRVARIISGDGLSTGDVAELRRISPERPYTPALWKLLLACVPPPWTAGPDQDEKERRWAALFMGMAMTQGLHTPEVPLGAALARAGWSELRFVRLMRERGDALTAQVRRMASYLGSKSQPADWTEVAHLLLDQEGVWAERHRMRIARSYYSTLYNQERTSAD